VSGRHILVIDDDEAVRTTLEVVLKEQGYEVTLSNDGLSGLAAFRARRPDLVITDIVMPVKEGLQTIKDIRREQPDVKIIAVSGGSRGGRHNFLDTARALGARDVILKPFDIDDFVARVNRCLGVR
jgi:DNA-binding response OmpR family regulator